MDSAWAIRVLKDRKSSIAKLARRVGRDRAAVSRIINDEQPLALWMVPHFAAELGVSELEVMKRAGLDVPSPQTVPVISWVAASGFANVDEPVLMDDVIERRISVDYPTAHLFALDVEGDSMDRIAPDGSIIVIDYTIKTLSNKDLGVFTQNGGTTFKRFRCDAQGVWLEPESWNERHAKIVPEGDEEIEIIGRVVAIPLIAKAE